MERRLIGSLAAVAEGRGDLDTAAQEYELVLAMHRAEGELVDVAVQAGNLSIVRTVQGRHQEAVSLAHEAREAAEVSRTLPYLVYAHAAAALAHAHAGDWSECDRELAAAGLVMAPDVQELGAAEHFAFQALARLLLSRSEPVAAALVVGILDRDADRMGELARRLTGAVEMQKDPQADAAQVRSQRAAGRSMPAAQAVEFLRRHVGDPGKPQPDSEFSLNAG